MKEKGKMNLRALILMIFTAVFGFTNMPRSFYLMGYSAIPWYIFSALTFFIPFAFMLAEYGAAFKDEKGGIYSWMEKSTNRKYAFIVTFMWYASYIVWMVNVGTGIWVVLSNAIFGYDRTQELSIFGLNSVQSLGICGILWIIFVTAFSSKGMEKIQKFTSVGGTAVALINVFLYIGGIIILILNKGQFQEAVTANAFIHSPNPDYISGTKVLSFVVYAIFAYGGIEVIGGLVDETENAEKTFPKGVALSAVIIAVGYSVGILIFGIFTNWTFTFTEFAKENVTLGNVSYIIMNQMGYQIGLAFGQTEEVARQIGSWVSRYMGISMFLSLTGAFFTLIFSPLKQLIGGTPKELWPKSWTKEKNGIYVNAMKYQALCVIVIIAIVSFGGSSAKKFFELLVSMTNVSMTLPYFFIAYSFLGFKKNDSIKKPFIKFKSMKITKLAVFIVCATVGFANLFTVVSPAITEHDYMTTIMSIAGPLFFTLIAVILYNRAEKANINN